MKKFSLERLADAIEYSKQVQWIDDDGNQIEGMTIKELAERSGVSVSYINQLAKMRKKNPSFDVVVRLCSVLRVNLYYITENYNEGVSNG